MKKINVISLILLFAHLTAAQSHLVKEIEKILKYDTYLERNAFPNILVGIVDHDSTYIVQLTTDQAESINEERIMEIGSVTKPVMSNLIISMSQAGLFNLNDPIDIHLPQLKGTDAGRLTIEQLLLQVVELPRVPPGIGKYEMEDDQPYALYPKKELLQYFKGLSIEKKNKASYSHIPHAILEMVVAEACDCTIDMALRQYFTDILEMNQTGFYFTPIIGTDIARQPAEPWVFNSFIGSLGMKSNMPDLIRFLRYQINKGKSSPELKDRIQSQLGGNISQSLAWMIVKDVGTYPIYHFSGRSNGNSAEICFIPETKTGVVVLTNTGRATQDLPFLILRMINDNWKRKS